MRVAQRGRRAHRATNLGCGDDIDAGMRASSDIWGDLSEVGQHIAVHVRHACQPLWRRSRRAKLRARDAAAAAKQRLRRRAVNRIIGNASLDGR